MTTVLPPGLLPETATKQGTNLGVSVDRCRGKQCRRSLTLTTVILGGRLKNLVLNRLIMVAGYLIRPAILLSRDLETTGILFSARVVVLIRPRTNN